MSEISSLTSQVQQLGDKADFWGTTVNAFIALTAIVAVLYFIATIRQSTINRRLRTSQEALLQAKDRQLASDLKEKDVKIGEANDSAGAANKAAGIANERAADLEKANLQLRTDLESARSEARSKASELEREQQRTALAQTEAAKAQLALEKYANEIASRGWPRSLDGRKFAERLKGKPKAHVELLYDPYTADAWVLARDIYRWLGRGVEGSQGAGWDVSVPKPIPTDAKLKSDPQLVDTPPAMRFSGAFTRFGLTVRMRYLDTPSGVTIPKASDCAPLSEDSRLCMFGAREALVEAIMLNILPEERGGDIQLETDDSIPEGTIVVVVGPKPPYWPFEFNPRKK